MFSNYFINHTAKLENWANPSENPNIEPTFKKNMAARGRNFVAGPISIATIFYDTFKGLFYSLAAIAKRGRDDKVNLRMVNHLDSTKKILSTPFENAIKTLNPNAKFGANRNIDNGLLTQLVKDFFEESRTECLDSNWFNRHITSRLTVALETVATMVTRVADFVIGSLATPFAILTAGRFEKLNKAAAQGLQITGIFTDLITNFVQFLNPKATLKMGVIPSNKPIMYFNHTLRPKIKPR